LILVAQLTSLAFTEVLKNAEIAISMDGGGELRDNVFVERLWRTIKYEEIDLRAYASVSEARASIARYLAFYNAGRPRLSLDRHTPDEAYFNQLQSIPAAVYPRPKTTYLTPVPVQTNRATSVLAAGPDATVLEGAYANNWTVIIRFPSRSVLDAWFAADAYAPLIEVRRTRTDTDASVLLALNAFAPAG
jgi:putative transposase